MQEYAGRRGRDARECQENRDESGSEGDSPLEAYLREVAPAELEERMSEGSKDVQNDETIPHAPEAVQVEARQGDVGVNQAVKPSGRAEQIFQPGMEDSRTASPSGPSSPLLVLQEQLNHLLVSYLSSPAHLHTLQLDDDEKASDSRCCNGSGEAATTDPRANAQPVVLTRKGQFILLSLFGLLVAYPHLPVPFGLKAVYSATALVTSTNTTGSGGNLVYNIWRAGPSILVATGLATIWAGQQATTPSLPPIVQSKDASNARQEPLQAQLLMLQNAVKRYLLSLNSYDSAVDRCLRALALLDATAATQGRFQGNNSQLSPINDSLHALLEIQTQDNTPPPANKVRQALWRILVSVEIAMKVGLDRMTREAREERGRTAVVDREELERLVGMYATKPTAKAVAARSPISLSASNPASRPMPGRNISMDLSDNRRASWAAFPTSSRQSMPFFGFAPPASSQSPGAASASATSPRNVQFGSPVSEVSRSPSNSALHRKMEKIRRRRSEQLPSRSSTSIQGSTSTAIDSGSLPSSPLASGLRSPPKAGNTLPKSASMRLSRSSDSPALPSARALDTESERERTLRRLHNLHSPAQSISRPAIARNDSSQRRIRPLSMFELELYSLSNHVPSASSVNRRQRPTSLYLQHSSMGGLSSPPVLSSEPANTWDGNRIGRNIYGLESLSEKGEEEKRMRREMICILLAVRYQGVIPRRRRASSASSATGSRRHTGDQEAGAALLRFLALSTETVRELSQILKKETASLTDALEAEFGSATALLTPLSPSYKQDSLTSARRRSLEERTPRQFRDQQESTQGLQIRFPGQYPQSPMIEVDPATPPLAVIDVEGTEYPFQTPSASVSTVQDAFAGTADETASFAPREPLSMEERQARETLTNAHSASQDIVKSLAAKMYLEKADLERYFATLESRSSDNVGKESSPASLQAIVQQHDDMKRDLEALLLQHNEGRLALRQLELKQLANSTAKQATSSAEELLTSSTGTGHTPDPADDSIVSSSALGKRDSTSSTLSTASDTDFISTPATSPVSQPYRRSRKTNGEFDVSQLLLEQTDPAHLPMPGLEEQLFEGFVAREVLPTSDGSRRMTREERIALAKRKREEAKEAGPERDTQPLAQMELVSELKNVVAMLRSRREVIPSEAGEQ